ncbi:hypothetical protein GMORB2_0108 [Geosmithia morbida]|uniref:Uncharacterized protein n=1 Tax=Geosmithia morbida TaxID=1094350 RepID=A0A9P4Z1F6_9HYPO|nr:uncharacterized protein GMORB2_0108 [Geosmithia morbida]KAF4126372.1 hypothetical protein GMORB2_0108 [Geosmithia morbida]
MDPITIDVPSKYSGTSSSTGVSSPAVDWLSGTWTVTHSTLSMWRSARNVRITYAKLPAKSSGGPTRLDDLVEYEPLGKKSGVVKTVEGIDTGDGEGGWDWRGKGLLFFVGSHWEVLAWGEATVGVGGGGRGHDTTGAGDGEVTERWAVTWFAPTVFTKEGIDVYCDRKEGISDRTYGAILDALKKVGIKELIDMVEKDLRPVEIRLPWAAGK